MIKTLIVFSFVFASFTAQAKWTCWSRENRFPLLIEWNEKTLAVSYRNQNCNLTRVPFNSESPLFSQWWKFDNLNKQTATYRTVCQNIGTPLFSEHMTEEIDLHWIKISRGLLDGHDSSIHVGFEKPGTNQTTSLFFYCSK